MYYTSSEKAKQLHTYTAYTVKPNSFEKFVFHSLTKLNYYGQNISQ